MMRGIFVVAFVLVVGAASPEIKRGACTSDLRDSEDELPRLTEDELFVYNGSAVELPIFLSYLGSVYDVSSARETYGPGGSYEVFAGRACTRGVALPSLRLEDVSDDIQDLVSEEQLKSLSHWKAFFEDKYPVVATLVPDDPEARRARVARSIAAREAEAEARVQASAQKAASNPSGKLFSVWELSRFNGSPSSPSPQLILLALHGHVLDVSKSAFLYGPGKPRGCYAGKDITRISALQGGVKGVSPCDANEIAKGSDLTGLTAGQLSTLRKRVAFFLDKFPKVGQMIETSADNE